MRIVIIPGMGCTPVQSSNWYSWLAQEVKSRHQMTVKECVLRDFPDPYQCKESVWIPFLRDEIGLDEDTILVGHSSGAACAMRLLEQHDKISFLKAVVLVAAAYTDLGEESERRSEYFNRPWNWEKMKQGVSQITCFHSKDDPLIDVSEARHISQKMESENFEYIEMDGKSHFFQPWTEILDVLDHIINNTKN